MQIEPKHGQISPSQTQILEILKSSKSAEIVNYYDFYKQAACDGQDVPECLDFVINILDVLKSLKITANDVSALNEVVKGQYEGGFLLWECERDLIKLVDEQNMRFDGLHVLDLGCGCGLLGLRMLQRGAASVTFHDYNKEVIQFWTVPNALLNFSEADVTTKMYFTTGDWKNIENDLKNDLVRTCGSANQDIGKYDIAVGCDILYETMHYATINQLLQGHLTDGGKAMIASKAYYYGNGGMIY